MRTPCTRMSPSTVRWIPSKRSAAASQSGSTKPSDAGPGNASHNHCQSAGTRISKTRASGWGVIRQIECGPSGGDPSAPSRNTGHHALGCPASADDVQIAVGGFPANPAAMVPSVGAAAAPPIQTCGRSKTVVRPPAGGRARRHLRASRSTTSADARSSQGQYRPGDADHFSEDTCSAASVTISYSALSDRSEIVRSAANSSATSMSSMRTPTGDPAIVSKVTAAELVAGLSAARCRRCGTASSRRPRSSGMSSPSASPTGRATCRTRRCTAQPRMLRPRPVMRSPEAVRSKVHRGVSSRTHPYCAIGIASGMRSPVMSLAYAFTTTQSGTMGVSRARVTTSSRPMPDTLGHGTG